jgi:hypothetical protein
MRQLDHKCNPIFKQPIKIITDISSQSLMLHWITLMEQQGFKKIIIKINPDNHTYTIEGS